MPCGKLHDHPHTIAGGEDTLSPRFMGVPPSTCKFVTPVELITCLMTLRGRQCHKAPLGQHHLNLKCICQALMHQSPPTKLIFACHLRCDLRCAPSCTCPSTAASSTAVSLHWWIAIFGLNVKQSHTNARPKSYLICLVHFVLRQRVKGTHSVTPETSLRCCTTKDELKCL